MSDNNDFTHELVVYNSDNNNGTQGTGKFLLYDDNINALKIESIDNIKIGGGEEGQILVTDGAGNLTWVTSSGGGGTQVNADWNSSSGASRILNKPDLTAYLPKSGGTLTGKLNAAQGAGTAGGYSFGGTEGGNDSGMFSNADGVVDFYANNVKVLTVTSSDVTTTQAITLPGNPTSNLQAATKQYVDSSVSALNNFSGNYNDLTNKPTVASNVYIGTTQIAFNRASGAITLAGVSIDGNAATVSNGVYTTGTYANPAWITSLAYSKLTGSPTLATVATSGSYTDLTNKPTLATVATSGSYTDLTNKPSIPAIPTNVSEFTNDAGYLTSVTNITGNAATVSNGVYTNGSYADPSWITSLAYDKLTGTPTIPDLTGYATESWVNSQGFGTSNIDTGNITFDGNNISAVEGSQVNIVSPDYVQFESNNNYLWVDGGGTHIEIFSGEGSGGEFQFTWDTGKPLLKLPAYADIVDSNGASVLGGGSGNPFNQDLNTTDDVTFNAVTVTNISGVENADGQRITNLYYNGTMLVGSNATQTPVSILIGGAGPRSEWQFTPDGVLTLPASSDGNAKVVSGTAIELQSDDNIWNFNAATLTAPSGAVIQGVDSSLTLKTTSQQTDSNLVQINQDSVDIYAYNVDNNTASQLTLSNSDPNNPYARILVRSTTNEAAWSFDTNGVINLPPGGDIRREGSSVLGGGSGISLPADAAGFLKNDGSGTLSWASAPAKLISPNGDFEVLLDDTGAVQLSSYGVVKNFDHVNMVSDGWVQMQWVDTQTLTDADPNATSGPTNWIYVDQSGIHVETNINGNINDSTQRYDWNFDIYGKLVMPANGDIVDSNGNSVLGGGGSSGVVPTGTTAPSSPVEGQLWYDSADGKTYVYFDNAWVDASPAGSGVSLPANASGYLTNDGAGNLAWAAGDGTFSGDYNDLVNKPTIPTDISDLSDNSNLLNSTTDRLTAGEDAAILDTDGNLTIPGYIYGQNNTAPIIIDAGATGDSFISIPSFLDGGEKLTIKNQYYGSNGIDIVTNGGTWTFDQYSTLTAPGDINSSGTVSADYLTINNDGQLYFNNLSSSITEARPGESFTFGGVATTAVTGSGSGAKINVSYNAGDTTYGVSGNDGGTYTYYVGDQLLVPGNLIGGVTPDNDLIVEVTSLYFDHAAPFAVYEVAVVSGTPPTYQDGLHIRTNGNEWTFGQDGNLHLNAGIKFDDGTVQTTAFTGGLAGWSIDTALNNSFVPTLDNLQDIGTPDNRVRHIYVGPGSITVGSSVITESNTGKLVLPGLTRGTGYEVTEVEDTGDQTYSFSSAPVVIDYAYFQLMSGNLPGFTPASYSVDGIDDEGYIDGISINSGGSGITEEGAIALRTNDMKAYIGSSLDPIGEWNANDWISIPFRARPKAGDVEYEFSTGGGASALENLDDVQLDGPSEGQVLTWNNSQEKWENRDPAGGSGSSNTLVNGYYSYTLDSSGNLTMNYDGSDMAAMFARDNNYYIDSFNGAVILSAGDSKEWAFGTNGILTIPEGGDIVDSNGTSVLGGGGNANTGNITFDGNTISSDGTGNGYPTLVNYPNSDGGVEIDYLDSNGDQRHAMWLNGEDGLQIRINSYGNGGTQSDWNFSNDGALTFPDGSKQTTASVGGVTTKTWTNPNENVWRIEEYNGGAAVSYDYPDNTIPYDAQETLTDVNYFALDTSAYPTQWTTLQTGRSFTINGTVYRMSGWSFAGGSTYNINFDGSASYTQGDIITITFGDTQQSMVPAVWWDAANSASGNDNFRGAIIEYHAYCNNGGTVIGKIIIAADGDNAITHMESMAAGSNLAEYELWYAPDYGKLAARRVGTDANSTDDQIWIQWTSKIFYGSEYNC